VISVIKKRSILRHSLGAIGAALFVAGILLFFILLLIDITSGASGNPYRSLVTFIVAPFIITVGFLLFMLSIAIQIKKARKRGEVFKFNFSFDTADPHYIRNIWIFLLLSAFLTILVIYSGTQAYNATDSVQFCGKTCHTVMAPQFVTYHNSAHARVRCADCHIGPGASFFVKAKIDGMRQVVATIFNTYSRPIQTPVKNLRPAQETCEGCHWPKKFYAEKLVTNTYYRTDENNSPWTIKMLVKIGGGNPRTGKLEGIHWHMIGPDKIEYVPADRKRDIINWVRVTKPNGDTVIYRHLDEKQPDFNDSKTEIRRFDCMDCHNRPSHNFLPPAKALNLALSTREISPQLKYVRKVGLDLLNAEYANRKEAHDSISMGLRNYYKKNYPNLYKDKKDKINQATKSLLKIYDQNFFPEMKTDYRVRQNDLTHFVNDGCFRCHDGVMQNDKGETLSNNCFTCHIIVAQGPSENVNDLQSNIAGLDFKHPEDIDQAWKEMKCTECHTPESGY